MKIPLIPMRAAVLALASLRRPAQDMADEPPRVKRPLRPEYPDDLRKTDETGCVILARYLDTKGQGRLLMAVRTA
jgi:hypothetical protein